MKIFVMRKENQMNKGKQNNENITLKKDEKFNYVIIKNPYNSNKICTINEIKVLTKDAPNKICLMIGEEDLYREWDEISDVKGIDIFNFKTKIIQEEYNSNIEINSSDILMDEEFNILMDFSIIMLPKGCIFIKLDKEVNFFNMNINWTSEEII